MFQKSWSRTFHTLEDSEVILKNDLDVYNCIWGCLLTTLPINLARTWWVFKVAGRIYTLGIYNTDRLIEIQGREGSTGVHFFLFFDNVLHRDLIKYSRIKHLDLIDNRNGACRAQSLAPGLLLKFRHDRD